jgi:hypothetical protein
MPGIDRDPHDASFSLVRLQEPRMATGHLDAHLTVIQRDLADALHRSPPPESQP